MRDDHGAEFVLDADLDSALRRIHADEATAGPERIRAGRERLIAAMADGPAESPQVVARFRGPRTRRILTGAAAAAVLAVGLLVVQTLLGSPLRPAATAAAVSTLNRAADLAVRVTDLPLAPGQFRYIRTDEASVSGFAKPGSTNENPADCAYRTRSTVEVWIPFDPNQEWLRRTTRSNDREWIACTQADDPRAPLSTPGFAEVRAAMGRFGGDFTGRENGRDIPYPEPGFANPTAGFLATLPRDPRELYEEIADQVGERPDLVFSEVTDLLGTGLAPGDLRAALYRAATYIPGVDIVDDVANLNGRRGVALGITRNGMVQEQLILDPATGDFLGKRSTVLVAEGGVPPHEGDSVAVSAAAVDGIGSAPR